MGDKLICLCNFVSENEIIKLLKKGAKTTEEIQEHLRAGTSCGKCLVQIDNIVKEYQEKLPPQAQQKLDF